jgi:hypothetical protein
VDSGNAILAAIIKQGHTISVRKAFDITDEYYMVAAIMALGIPTFKRGQTSL